MRLRHDIVFWLEGESLEGSESLVPLDIIAEGIPETLESALEQSSGVYEDLNTG